MGWYQIGKGYYGVTTEPGSSTQADQDQTARVFREVFSIPAAKIQIDSGRDEKEPKAGRARGTAR